VFKNGVFVPNCDDPGTGAAVPDPCVAGRVFLGDIDVQITVFSSTASTWNFATPQAPPLPAMSARGFYLLAAFVTLTMGFAMRRRRGAR